MIAIIGIAALAVAFAVWMRLEMRRAIPLDDAESAWIESLCLTCEADHRPCDACMNGETCEGRKS